jgi:hypothetical protein
MNTDSCLCRPPRSLPARLAVLAAVMLVAYGGVVWLTVDSPAGMAAVSLAAGVCLASAAAALLISAWLGTAANGAAAMVLPMMVRAGLPLVLAVLVRLRGRGLVEASFVYYLIGFYLLALMVELPMSLPRTVESKQSAAAESEGAKLHG